MKSPWLSIFTTLEYLICRLPVPRMGKVLGIVGANSIGKTTSVKILAGELKPNLGNVKVKSLSSFCVLFAENAVTL